MSYQVIVTKWFQALDENRDDSIDCDTYERALEILRHYNAQAVRRTVCESKGGFGADFIVLKAKIVLK